MLISTRNQNYCYGTYLWIFLYHWVRNRSHDLL